MTRLLPCEAHPILRSHEDTHMLVAFADQIFAEARICHNIRFGDWLFLARLGESGPARDKATENRLWTAVAGIGPDTAPRPDWLPEEMTIDLITSQPNSTTIHEKGTDALERIAAFDGAGIAICLDRNNPRNDDLIRSLTCLLEPRHPDDTGPMVWYGDPPGPPAFNSSSAGGCA